MSNPMQDYVEHFRANLPTGITFNSTLNRYFFNGKSFANEWDVFRYSVYLTKLGSSAAYRAGGINPNLVADFTKNFYVGV